MSTAFASEGFCHYRTTQRRHKTRPWEDESCEPQQCFSRLKLLMILRNLALSWHTAAGDLFYLSYLGLWIRLCKRDMIQPDDF